MPSSCSSAHASVATAAEARGLDVLLDDRPDASPGVKLTDAELLGVPTLLVVGRGLARGTVERFDRSTGDRAEVPLAPLVAGEPDAWVAVAG